MNGRQSTRSGVSRSSFGEVFQAAPPRWIAGLAGTQSGFGLGHNEIFCGGIAFKICLADTEAIAQQSVPVLFLHPDAGTQPGLEDSRIVIAEISDGAGGVSAKVVMLGSRRPGPRRLDVVGDGAHRDFRVFPAVSGATVFFGMLAGAVG